jgi:hypothetical protein
MTHHERRNAAAGRAVKPVNITAANATRGHANKKFVMARCGYGHVCDFELFILGKEQSLHFSFLMNGIEE